MTTAGPISGLRFSAALSTEADTAQAIDDVCRQAAEQLAAPPQLALCFASQHHAEAFDVLGAELCSRLGTDNLIGCSGESIVGGGREIEEQPALALWLAHLPGVTLHKLDLQFVQTPEGGSFAGWPADLPEPWPAGAALLLLGDPFSFPADELVRRLNEDQPGVPVIGGMASGAWQPGGNRLWLGDQAKDRGAVAILVHGPVRIRTVVSQGCRPIGRTFVVTKAQQNMILDLSGEPALQRLQEVFATLNPAEQQLVRQGLHLGRALSEYHDEFRRGDFLVRNVIGADPDSGAVAVGDYLRVGQTVQFHVRDASTADEDLRQLLTPLQGAAAGPAGGLLFTCNGRGTRLFGQPDHDAGCVRAALGELPLAGFFAQGELGPVGGQNFLHGFTASIALFDTPPD